MTSGTLVLNSCGTVLTSVSWEQAVSLVVREKAEIVESDPNRLIRSKSLSIPFPRVIRLIKWVYVKFRNKKPYGENIATKRGILTRDKFTCGYCGGIADTVDHIIPISHGGKLTWVNCIAACKPCNGRKADRTPEQAKMKLMYEPWEPTIQGALQRGVWAIL